MATETIKLGKKTVEIPVGPDGYVPQDELVKHFLSTVKDTNKDYDEHASVVLPVNVTPRQAASWWIRPNRHDITYVDAPGEPHYNTDHIKDEESRKIHQKIGLICTPDQEKKLRQMIDETYTVDEKKKMVKNGGILMLVRPLKDSSGDIVDRLIRLDTATGINESTLVHEGTHHLRRVDEERKNKLTRSAVHLPIKGEGKSAKKKHEDAILRKINVEESCTVAEQMARAKQPATGYYAFVQVYDKKTKKWRYPTDKESIQMMNEDRMLMTHGTGRPLPPKEAVKSVESNWIKSHISRLKMPTAPRQAVKEIELIEQSNEISQKALSDLKYRPTVKKGSSNRKAAMPAANKSSAKAAGKSKQTAKKSVKSTQKNQRVQVAGGKK